MNPTILGRLGLVVGAALAAYPLCAQPPPASPDYCGTDPNMIPAGSPVGAIHAHLCGFHFYAGDMARALRAEHYCSHLNADVFQCVIYDATAPNARLIGVEYVISEALFLQLPAEEKQLWHSHRYEVMSGLLTAPDLAPAAEKELMREFVGTYGKTWNLWQIDRGDTLPLGLPKLMMGFTADGQADPSLLAARDQDQKIDSTQVKANRADLPVRPVAAGADAWQQGPAFQIPASLLKPTPKP